MKDWLGDRFARKEKDRKLKDLAKKGMTPEEIEAEEKLIKESKKVEQLAAKSKPGRNDPCPCGSGKKYKKCCGAKK